MPQWEYCTLAHDDETIYYTLYQEPEPYEEERPYDEILWGACIATLGRLRWEALNTHILISPETHLQAWHFKRPIQPGNDYLTFQ